MKKILLLILFVQCITIGILFYNLYKKTSILDSTNINPVNKESIISFASGKLLYFYEPKTGISKPEVIFPGLENVSYHINSDRLNQLSDYPATKEAGIFRIATIGDSFTFGQNVNTEDNYPSDLEYMLNTKLSCPSIKKFEVINLGVWGYDIAYTIERFRLRGVRYHPDLAIWLLVPDDFERVQELLYPKVEHYIQEARQNGEYQKRITQGTYYKEWFQAEDEVINDLGGKERILTLQREYMSKLDKFYTGPLLLTAFPGLPKPYDTFLQEYKNSRPNTFLNYDLPNIYTIADAALPDSHPSKKGHALIAENIMHYLVTTKRIPCSLK